MKRILAILALALLVGACARADAEFAAREELPATGARAAVLIERESGRVLYASNADEALPIASVTKIMTALLTIERCAEDEIITASENASGVPGTSIYLGVGERLTAREMLLGLMLRSGNDAAVALAEHVGGSVEGFAALMNARAEALGADARFVTPNGLDAEGHLASALGVALIAREALGNERFRELVATKEAVIPWRDSQYSRVLRNKNRLLAEYEGATGVKTGFTSKAGRCLAFSARRGGMELIGVVLNCGDWFNSAEALLDWGFASCRQVAPLDAGGVAGEVAVTGGEAESVAAVAARAVRAPVMEGEAWALRVVLDGQIAAPVSAGETLGEAYIEIDGEAYCRTPLVAAGDVPKRDFWGALRRVFRRWGI